MIDKRTLLFLKNLENNNHKEWFHDHQKEYKALKDNVLDFTAAFLKEFGKIDPTIAHLEPKKCLFRINRDIRFSKNKDPYKTNIGISMNKNGKKTDTAGYYVNIEPSGSFIGGGLYMIMPDDLKKIRQEIDYNLENFEAIIHDNDFSSYYGGLSIIDKLKLKRPPKGYKAENPAIEYLKLKSFTAIRPLSDQEVISKDFLKECVKGMTVLKPLVDFLITATVQESEN